MSNIKNRYYDLISKIPYPYIDVPVFNTHGKLIIALFEFRVLREIKHVINAILNVYHSYEIGFSIVHGECNKDYIKKEFGNWKNILLINTGDRNHNGRSYSNRLIKPELWENFKPWSHILVYQCDALILKKIPDIYFNYDYIGAKWKKTSMGGNGGFSLRRVESMIKVCESYRGKCITSYVCPHTHEDGFFCRQNEFKYPDNKEKHEEFAVESVYNDDPIGLHKFYKWITNNDDLEKIMINIENKLIKNKNKEYFRLTTEKYISAEYFLSKGNIILYNDKMRERIDKKEFFNLVSVKSKPLIISIHSQSIDYFAKWLIEINDPFMLITNYGLQNVPCLKNKIHVELMKKSNLIKWYTQNMGCTNEKVEPIPLGSKWKTTYDSFKENMNIKYKSLEKLGMNNAEENFYTVKNNLLYFGGLHPTTHKSRENLKDILVNFKQCEKLHFDKYLEKLKTYKFHISPPGKGVDTHRCWETLLCGCIPILLKSNFDVLFNDLPVLIVEDYSMINEDYLNKNYDRLINKKYNFKKLYTKYWDDEIENTLINFEK